VRLCDGLFGSVFRFDGELMHLAAHHNYTQTAHHALLEMLPMQPRLDSPLTAARAILTRAVVQFEDLEDADTAREYAQHVARAAGFRSGLAVPMLREGNAVGAIFVAREQPGLFSAARIELLQTFADQAVIAIENVRLFTELQEKNQALTTAHAQVTEALEQQIRAHLVRGVHERLGCLALHAREAHVETRRKSEDPCVVPRSTSASIATSAGSGIFFLPATSLIAERKHVDQPAANSCSGLVPPPGPPRKEIFTSSRPSSVREDPPSRPPWCELWRCKGSSRGSSFSPSRGFGHGTPLTSLKSGRRRE
jgi:hypothetical protein